MSAIARLAADTTSIDRLHDYDAFSAAAWAAGDTVARLAEGSA